MHLWNKAVLASLKNEQNFIIGYLFKVRCMMFVLHCLFLFVVTFNIALSNSVFNDEMYKKKTLILRRKFQQLIVSNCVSYCYTMMIQERKCWEDAK